MICKQMISYIVLMTNSTDFFFNNVVKKFLTFRCSRRCFIHKIKAIFHTIISHQQSGIQNNQQDHFNLQVNARLSPQHQQHTWLWVWEIERTSLTCCCTCPAPSGKPASIPPAASSRRLIFALRSIPENQSDEEFNTSETPVCLSTFKLPLETSDTRLCFLYV